MESGDQECRRLPKVAQDCHLANLDGRLEILGFAPSLPKIANICLVVF